MPVSGAIIVMIRPCFAAANWRPGTIPRFDQALRLKSRIKGFEPVRTGGGVLHHGTDLTGTGAIVNHGAEIVDHAGQTFVFLFNTQFLVNTIKDFIGSFPI